MASEEFFVYSFTVALNEPFFFHLSYLKTFAIASDLISNTNLKTNSLYKKSLTCWCINYCKLILSLSIMSSGVSYKRT